MFKVGDMVVCVKNDFFNNTLIIGKKYEVINKITLSYMTINLGTTDLIVEEDGFVSLIEYRKLKLTKICTKLGIK